jgi:hypothetical protein
MSDFDNAFAATGSPGHFAFFGGTLTLTPKGAAPVVVTGVIGRERREDRDGSHGRRAFRVRDIRITNDPTGPFGGVANPQMNATVTIAGEEWAVEKISGPVGGEYTVTVVREAVIQTSKPNYRS